MFFAWFKLLVALIVVVTTSSATEITAGRKQHDRYRALLKRVAKVANLYETETHSLSVQANLRTVNEESRFRQGYAFIAEYSGSSCSDADFKQLTIFKLNECAASNDRTRSRKARAWTTAKGNIGLTYNDWEGDDCKHDWSKDDSYFPDNTCFSGLKVWTGPFPEDPPAYITGSVGFYEIFDNQKCLHSQDLTRDFVYAEFNRIGSCIEYDPEEPDRDAMITGCSDMTGVQVARYNSQDGSCTSLVDSHVYNPKSVCLWYDIFEETTFGWVKYGCY